MIDVNMNKRIDDFISDNDEQLMIIFNDYISTRSITTTRMDPLESERVNEKYDRFKGLESEFRIRIKEIIIKYLGRCGYQHFVKEVYSLKQAARGEDRSKLAGDEIKITSHIELVVLLCNKDFYRDLTRSGFKDYAELYEKILIFLNVQNNFNDLKTIFGIDDSVNDSNFKENMYETIARYLSYDGYADYITEVNKYNVEKQYLKATQIRSLIIFLFKNGFIEELDNNNFPIAKGFSKRPHHVTQAALHTITTALTRAKADAAVAAAEAAKVLKETYEAGKGAGYAMGVTGVGWARVEDIIMHEEFNKDYDNEVATITSAAEAAAAKTADEKVVAAAVRVAAAEVARTKARAGPDNRQPTNSLGCGALVLPSREWTAQYPVE